MLASSVNDAEVVEKLYLSIAVSADKVIPPTVRVPGKYSIIPKFDFKK